MHCAVHRRTLVGPARAVKNAEMVLGHCGRLETQVTFCVGHMGNTCGHLAGGVDTVEMEFGDGITSKIASPLA